MSKQKKNIAAKKAAEPTDSAKASQAAACTTLTVRQQPNTADVLDVHAAIGVDKDALLDKYVLDEHTRIRELLAPEMTLLSSLEQSLNEMYRQVTEQVEAFRLRLLQELPLEQQQLLTAFHVYAERVKTPWNEGDRLNPRMHLEVPNEPVDTVAFPESVPNINTYGYGWVLANIEFGNVFCLPSAALPLPGLADLQMRIKQMRHNISKQQQYVLALRQQLAEVNTVFRRRVDAAITHAVLKQSEQGRVLLAVCADIKSPNIAR